MIKMLTTYRRLGRHRRRHLRPSRPGNTRLARPQGLRSGATASMLLKRNSQAEAQCDSDIMLARRIRRDIQERGRDVEGVLAQYLKFVKPSFDNFVLPTSRHADIVRFRASSCPEVLGTECVDRAWLFERRRDRHHRHAYSQAGASPYLLWRSLGLENPHSSTSAT